ncbi:MAG TPA: FtsX-like permease family protein [Cyclobacteriaceae bacterium]|nr:FtsX-like permease family protein [Cyclobacteriaceae bacterium]
MVFLRTLKSGLRHLLSQKLNSLVHVAGLSLGMTVCLLIGLFIRFETSFDSYHPHASRTYRINQAWTDNGDVNDHYSTPIPLAEVLRKDVSGLEYVAFGQPAWNTIIDLPGKRLQQENILITDPTFLDVFSADVVKGDGHQTLRTPYHALLTESTAKKFFGTEDPIGKTFRFKSKYDITVGGIIRDLPANTHLPATMLLSYVADEDYLGAGPDAWTYTAGNATFVVLPDGYDQSLLLAQLKKIADARINSNPEVPKFVRTDFVLLPLADIHFDAKSQGSAWVPAFSSTWLWFFGAIGIAVLTLACINFVNLSTAQALTRAREVGVRKSIGADRTNLLLQFLGESWMLAGVSSIIAIGAVEFSLPYMNTLLETGIKFELTGSPELMLSLAGAVVIIGLLAGIYPAWVITKFNPAMSLRSGFNVQGESGGSWLKRSLIVTQFTISAGLLIALVLISQQVDFVRTMSLGFNKDNMLIIQTGDRGTSATFDHELEKIPAVDKWSYSTSSASAEGHWGTIMSKTNGNDPARQPVTSIYADENYCELYGFKLIAGDYPVASDTNLISDRLPDDQKLMKAVVNEKLIDALDLGTPDEAVGKHFWFGMGNGDVEITGVVGNFNTLSAREAIKPTIIGQLPPVYRYANIRIQKGADVPSMIASIEKAWKMAYPDGVFAYNFLDQQIDNFYKAEDRIYTLFKVFSGLAMLISCLGLWGLITFAAQRRMKEIGIRKVLGATATSLMVLLSRDFFFMVLASLVIATPLVYYGISQWLNDFAFKISIGWQAFAVAGVTSLVLALMTVGIQALRATFTNPASILKSE